MIDEKPLDLLEASAKTHQQAGSQMLCTPDDVLKLVRLARLGLWASQHKTVIEDCLHGCSGDFCPGGEPDAIKALEALPK